jgi:acetyl-CoA carboxylase carboxyl transferase subunit beta
MTWYSKAITEKKQQKKTLWVKCKQCQSHIWQEEWQSNHNVCPNCNYHGSITAYERIELLFDKGSFNELFAGVSPVDSLNFVDLKGSYKDKIVENRKKSGISESVVTGEGKDK